MKKCVIALTVFLLLASYRLAAQCNANVSVCNSGIAGPFTFINTIGPGVTYANPQGCSTGLFTPNDEYAFITLYITSSGNLNMLVDGDATSGFLDVIVYDVPSGQTPCAAAMNSANEIACNYASNSSGCVQIGSAFPCPSTITPVPVVAGQVLMVIVNNYSGSSTSFNLSLDTSPGSAQSGSPNATINNLTIAGLPNNTICSASSPVQLSATNNGGNWSGTGVSSSGLFNPSVAGVGSHVINYSIGTAPCNATSSKTITVIASPTLAVNSASICTSQSALLSSTVSMAGGTYNWTPLTNLSSGVTPTVMANPSSSITYLLMYTAPNSCTVNATSQVIVNPTPTVNLMTNGQVCSGATIDLTASVGAATYNWSGPLSFSQTTSTNTVSVTNSNTGMSGTYTVVATSVAGCSVSATATLNVIPTSSITVANSLSTCQGGTINLTASANSANSYSWVGPLAYSSTLQNPVLINTQPNQSGIYTVTANFVSGSVTCSTYNTTNVTIIPATTVALSPMPTVCNNGTINLMAPNGGNTYVWSGPNSFSSSAQNPTITNAGILNQGVYSLSVTTSGCVNTGTVNVAVYDVLNFASVPSNTTLCEGKTANLSSSGFGGSGVYSFSWNPPTDLSNPNSAVTTVTGNTTTNYSLTMGDANCPITNSVSTNVWVTVNLKPIISFNVNDARGCEPFTTGFSSFSIPSSVNCQWEFGNTLSYNGCSTSSFLFSEPNAYDVKLTVTDINGCIDSVKQKGFVTVDPKPDVHFDWTPDEPTVLINEVNFSDHSTTGLPMQKWHWSFGDYFSSPDSDTSNLQNPSHVYTNVGSYPVSLEATNSFGCSRIIGAELKIADEFALYIPNAFSPTKQEGVNDVFNIYGMGFSPDTFEMLIYDRWGNVLFKTNDPYKGWDGTMANGAKAAPNVYAYKIYVKDHKLHEQSFVGYVTLL